MDEIPASDALPAAMAEAEKMLALKKAYADVILNTAKEAAARVLAAEWKAKKCEKELEFTKEEAIRMLIRMKQMMEATNSESAVKSMIQQNKIKELELQLDEAEGLILDLRAKLTKFEEQAVHSSREKESTNQLCSQSSLSDLESNSAASKLQAPSLDHHSMVHQFPGPLAEHLTLTSEFDRCLVDNPVFDFIFFRKGEPEVCNKECIRRIRAIEKDLIEGRMPLADNLDECKSLDLKNEQLGVKFSVPSTTHKLDFVENIASGKPLLIDIATNGWSHKIQILRRRRTRQGKSNSKARGCRYLSGRYMKSQRTFSAISRCNTYLPSGTIVDRSGNLFKMNGRNEAEKVSEINRMDDVFTSHCKEDISHGKLEPVSIARRSTRKRKVKQWDGFSTLCKRNGANSHQNEGSCKKSQESDCYAESNEHLLDGKYEVEVEDFTCGAPLRNIRKCIEASGDTGDAKVSENKYSLIDVPMLVTPATMELEDISLVPSDKKGKRILRLTNRVESEHQSSKSTGNTSCRKHKNGLWMNLGSGEQSKSDLMPQASLVNDSLDDSKGLVQIAHQLISLSAKGWQ